MALFYFEGGILAVKKFWKIKIMRGRLCEMVCGDIVDILTILVRW